jgi:hypothetical protein
VAACTTSGSATGAAPPTASWWSVAATPRAPGRRPGSAPLSDAPKTPLLSVLEPTGDDRRARALPPSWKSDDVRHLHGAAPGPGRASAAQRLPAGAAGQHAGRRCGEPGRAPVGWGPVGAERDPARPRRAPRTPRSGHAGRRGPGDARGTLPNGALRRDGSASWARRSSPTRRCDRWWRRRWCDRETLGVSTDWSSGQRETWPSCAWRPTIGCGCSSRRWSGRPGARTSCCPERAWLRPQPSATQVQPTPTAMASAPLPAITCRRPRPPSRWMSRPSSEPKRPMEPTAPTR